MCGHPGPRLLWALVALLGPRHLWVSCPRAAWFARGGFSTLMGVSCSFQEVRRAVNPTDCGATKVTRKESGGGSEPTRNAANKTKSCRSSAPSDGVNRNPLFLPSVPQPLGYFVSFCFTSSFLPFISLMIASFSSCALQALTGHSCHSAEKGVRIPSIPPIPSSAGTSHPPALFAGSRRKLRVTPAGGASAACLRRIPANSQVVFRASFLSSKGENCARLMNSIPSALPHQFWR